MSPGLHVLEKLLRVCTNLRFGSRRDEQLSNDNPVLAVLAVASEEVLVLFLRPPARVSSRLASWCKNERGKPTKSNTKNELLLFCHPMFTMNFNVDYYKYSQKENQ